MPRYTYEALQADGISVSGTIDAPDELKALEFVSGRGLTPVDLKIGTKNGPWWSREFSFSGATSVKARDLEAFFESFATLLSAKLPLAGTLAICEDQTRNRELAQSISELRSDIENGQTLSQALNAQNKIIPERLQTLLRLGESSNTLAEAVERTAAMLKSEAEMARELRAALVYPAILLGMSLLVLALIVFYLAPTLAPVFATAGAAPPPVLRAMIGVRNILTEHLTEGIIVFAAFTMLMVIFRLNLRRVFQRTLSRLPVAGTYLNQRETLGFCRNLSLMLGSGATLPEALASAETATDALLWQATIRNTREGVEAGRSLSAGLDAFPRFEPMALSLIKVGEESDSLVAMLGSAVDVLEDTTKTTLQHSLRLLTPLLTLVIGGLVGLLIISTISAILDLNDIAF